MADFLNEAQRERLDLLVEEMGEVAQAIGKIGRHGFTGVLDRPTLALDDYTANTTKRVHFNNRADLCRELGNLQAVILRMVDAHDISEFDLAVARVEHMKKLPEFTYFQPDSRAVRK